MAASALCSRAPAKGSASCAGPSRRSSRPAGRRWAGCFSSVAVYVTLLAFNIHLPLIAAAAVLAVMNVALVLPLWPGNLGVLQAAIAIPLTAYGVPLPRAIAYGIALQAIESSVGYTFGIACLFREGLSFERLRAMGARDLATI